MVAAVVVQAEHELIEKHDKPYVGFKAVADHLGVRVTDVIECYAVTTPDEMSAAIRDCALCAN